MEESTTQPWSESELTAAAKSLWEAEATRAAVAPLTESRPLGIADAYRVQLANADKRLATGERLVGYKIGLTSAAARRDLGIDHPDVGHLFASMLVSEEAGIPAGRLIQPLTEAEIAFVFGREISGPGVTWWQAARAIDSVLPALEIVDSRIKDWRIKAADTVADNASSARFVLGSRQLPLHAFDLADEGMALWKNGDVEGTGSGAAVMGNPLEAVAVAINELATLGRSIKAGDVILSGAMSRMLPARPGDWFRAEFRRLGAVSVRFGEER